MISPLGDRDAFLGEVRARLADGTRHLRPVTPEPAPPPIDYEVDRHDLVGTFSAAAGALGVTVDDVDDPAGYLTRLCADREIRRAVVSDDPECTDLTGVLEDAGVELVALGDIDGAADADLGVTGAVCGVAVTGSLVVDSRRAGARTASLLPPLHLALLHREAILPDAGTLLRDLDSVLPDGLPSNLVFITGPSKSADIELQLTVGVHGPRELVVGLL